MFTQKLKTHLPLFLAVLFLPLLVSSVAPHSTLPSITNVQHDLPNNRLAINGSGFGARRAPSVSLPNIGAIDSQGQQESKVEAGATGVVGPRGADLRTEAATFDAATCQNLDNTALIGTLIQPGTCRITLPAGGVDGYPLPFVSLGSINSFSLNSDGSGEISVSRTDAEFFFVLITSAVPPAHTIKVKTNSEEPLTDNMTNRTAAPSRTMNARSQP
jgi:hypothetical protein